MRALAGAELLIILALLAVAWLLKVQASQLALLEADLDSLRMRDPWAGRMPS